MTTAEREIRRYRSRPCGIICRMDPNLPTCDLRLWRADAIVPFDWLMSADLNSVPITHPAQKQALVDLLGRLEVDTDVRFSTSEEIEQAQAEVAKDMGW